MDKTLITGIRGLLPLLLILAAAVPAHSASAPENDAYVNFSFDEADLRLVIKLVGEKTGRRFILDDRVTGAVTVVTPPRIPVEQIYPFLLTILHSRGYSVLERDGIHHVVPLPARELPDAPVYGEHMDAREAQGVITRIVRVRHINVLELQRLLRPMVPGAEAGSLIAFGPTNHLVITDVAENIRRLEGIIAELDQEGAESSVEVVPLEHASADELARQLMAAMAGAETAGRRLSRHMEQIREGGAGQPGEALVVPAAHANSLLLVGAPLQIARLRSLIEVLDVETVSGYGRLNVIFLKYLNAEEAAESLNNLLTKSAEQEERTVLSVEPSVANNALLVDASPRDFRILTDLVDRLDLPPQQVMVEILIAEVSMDTQLDIGFEWSAIDQPTRGSTTVIGRSTPGKEDTLERILDGAFPEGLTLGIARGGTFEGPGGVMLPRVPFLLRAMAADRDVKILSNIPLWAQNNMEASVSVVNNIPILESTIEGAGTARDIIQNIERTDVGIHLKVTPYVNPDNEVRMKLNPIIEAILDDDSSSDMRYTPTIARREVDTTVTIPDKATVVLSGLMREDKIQTVSKVPLLGDIPLLGRLFRRTGDRMERTNLLIFVTPHIVTDLKSAERLRDAMEQQTTIDRTEGEIQLPPDASDVQPE